MDLYERSLREHRGELDSLNVFPVPDGDTGANMLRTQVRVTEAIAGLGVSADDLEALCAAIADGSLLGARGNSGVILSQVLRGMCETLRLEARPGAGAFAAALRRASDDAYRAVAAPAEGTVLTVLREAAAAAASAAEGGATLAETAAAALHAARVALGRTRQDHPVLREAGVVDAGGKGALLLFDALHAAIVDAPLGEGIGPEGPLRRLEAERPLTAAMRRPAGAGGFGTEVQALLEAPEEAVAPLRLALGAIGDSLVFVGGRGLYNVHVHTNRPERAVQAMEAAGPIREVSIVDLGGEVEGCLRGEARGVRVGDAASALVALAEGEGLMRVLGSLGATVIRSLDGAIDRPAASSVLVVPTSSAGLAEARRAAAASAPGTRVIDVASVPGALAAAAAFDPSADGDANVRTMGEAAAACRSGVLGRRDEGWTAERDEAAAAEADVAARSVARDPCAAALALVEALRGASDPDLVTIVVGADGAAEQARGIARALRQRFATAEVETVEGGQPGAPYALGVG